MEVSLVSKYKEKVVPNLIEKFSYKNVHQVPKLVKISLNMGIGEAVQNPKAVDVCYEALKSIAGQKPVVTRARKSIAAFKLREGSQIGCMVTLRSTRMFDFLDMLIRVALPRFKDFRGLSQHSFDGRGNYSFGIKEQIVFPQVEVEKLDKIRGLSVQIVTTANTDEEARFLLKEIGLPFRS